MRTLPQDACSFVLNEKAFWKVWGGGDSENKFRKMGKSQLECPYSDDFDCRHT